MKNHALTRPRLDRRGLVALALARLLAGAFDILYSRKQEALHWRAMHLRPCKACHAPIYIDADFCSHCGIALSVAAKTATGPLAACHLPPLLPLPKELEPLVEEANAHPDQRILARAYERLLSSTQSMPAVRPSEGKQ